MKYIVNFSGGVSSWAAAKLVSQEYGPDAMQLVFADTCMEDADLYRFLFQAWQSIGAPLEIVMDGRTPWEVFYDERFLGNSLVDPCSRILKREQINAWIASRFKTSEYISVFGYQSHEVKRMRKLKARMEKVGITVLFPLADRADLTTLEICRWLEREGIDPPRLYDLGFSHNNCGGFCVKAGQRHFAMLLRELPDVYALHEEKERRFREWIGKDVSVMRDRRHGTSKPMTMEVFRKRLEAGGQYDRLDFGQACACFEYGDDSLTPEIEPT